MKTKKLEYPYGRSYFGSGGAWGKIKTCDNCQPTGEHDNGFIRTATGVQVINQNHPAHFTATGGDAIGDATRTWTEKGFWRPGKVSGGKWV